MGRGSIGRTHPCAPEPAALNRLAGELALAMEEGLLGVANDEPQLLEGLVLKSPAPLPRLDRAQRFGRPGYPGWR
jgi:hypothetical protein